MAKTKETRVKMIGRASKSDALNIAMCLKWLLYIDTSGLVMNGNESRSSFKKFLWISSRLLLILFQSLCIALIIARQKCLEIHGYQSGDWFGDFHRFFGGVQAFYNYASVIYTTFGLFMMLFTWYFQRSAKNKAIVNMFIMPLDVIAGLRPPDDIGLDSNSHEKLKKRSKLVFNITLNVVRTFLGMFAIYIPIVYIRNIDLTKYWLNCLVAWTIWLISNLINISTHCLCLAYFHLICLTFELRIKLQKERLQTHKPNFGSAKFLICVIIEQCNICNAIAIYDKFWSKYIFASHSCFLPLMSCMLYICFVPEGELILNVILFIVFLEFSCILTFICLSAASISNQVTLWNKLKSYQLINYHINLQVKCLHTAITSLYGQLKLNMIVKQKLFRTLSRHENGHAVGFSCGGWFVVTYISYLKVFRAYLTRKNIDLISCILLLSNRFCLKSGQIFFCFCLLLDVVSVVCI